MSVRKNYWARDTPRSKKTSFLAHEDCRGVNRQKIFFEQKNLAGGGVFCAEIRISKAI